jgi:hypothetical protein
MNQNLKFVSFILLVKLTCNKDCVYGLNRVLANIVKKFKIRYMAIFFFCNIHSYRKRETSQGDFSI